MRRRGPPDAPRHASVTWVGDRGSAFELRVRSRLERLADELAVLTLGSRPIDPQVRSPMPGTVVSVDVATGDSVVAGQVLLTIEAMKMEHRVVAPSDGIVTLTVRPTDQVALDQVVATIAPRPHDGRPSRRRDPGMTYELTPEQQLRDEVRDFADTVVAPAAYKYDTLRELPYEILGQMGEMGLFGLPFPIEYGGQGRDYVDLCLAVEQLARVDQSIAVTLEAGVGLGAMPVWRSGTDAQKQEWIPMLAQGKALAGFGLRRPTPGPTPAPRPPALLDDGGGSSTAPSSSSPTPAPRSRGW